MSAQSHNTSLTVSFDPKNGQRGESLSLKQFGVLPTSDYTFPFDLGVQQIPDVDAILVASHGTLEVEETGRVITKPSQLFVVQFTEFIPSLSDTLDVLFAVDNLGNPIGPTFTYDDVNKRFIPSEKFFGLVRLGRYDVGFRVLRHRMERTMSYGYPVPIYGSVAAIYNNTITVLNVEPAPNPAITKFEIYRKVSQVLVNKQGAWEMPTGWPNSPAYPGGVTPVPAPKIGLVTERVHVIGWGEHTGATWEDTAGIRVEKPYSGAYSEFYNPPGRVITFKEANWPKTALDPQVRDQIQAVVDKASTS